MVCLTNDATQPVHPRHDGSKFLKITQTIPTSKTTSMHITNLFFDYWIVSYELPRYPLANNGVQFTSKFFATLRTLHDVKHIITTAYHPQTKSKAGRYNRAILICLRHYVTEHQKDWNTFLQRLTHALHAKVLRSTNQTLYNLVSRQQLPGPTL